MSRTTTVAIPKRQKLTKRQELDVRTIMLRKVGKVTRRLIDQACGTLTEKVVDKDTGEVEIVKCDMTSAELRAAEIILRKTVPDLSSVVVEQKDPMAGLSREEMIHMLARLQANPQVAEMLQSTMPDIQATKQDDPSPTVLNEDKEINATYRVESDD